METAILAISILNLIGLVGVVWVAMKVADVMLTVGTLFGMKSSKK